MNSKVLKQLLLYRYRYVAGYVLFVLSLVIFLFTDLAQVPQGLSQAEMASAARSANTSLRELTPLIDLPYHLLQKASIHLFGLTEVAVRLPSVTVAFLTGIGTLLLMHRWFKPNIAIIASIITATNSVFLVTGRTGEPGIMILFFGIFILLLSTLVAQDAKGSALWKTLLLAVIGLSLYTPLSVYIIIAALVAGLLHPHTRYVLQRFGSIELLLGFILLAVIMIPFGLEVFRQRPDEMLATAYRLLAIPVTMPSLDQYLNQGWQSLLQAGNFINPRIDVIIQPAFSIVSLILIVLGIIRTLMESFAARTYALLIWTAILLPLVTLQPEYFPVIFIPTMLYMAVGIQALVNEWYTFFPFNPYARTLALLPLAALLSGLWFLNYTTYFYGYRYSEETARVYNQDLGLLNKVLAEKGANNTRVDVVVPANQHAFYKPLQRDQPNISVVKPDGELSPKAKFVIVAESLSGAANYGLLESLVVSDEREQPLRWRVYQMTLSSVVQ